MDAQLPRVHARYARLLYALLNLLRHSQRALAGQEQAHIQIEATQLGDVVLVAFADNGPCAEHPESLFQPFQPRAHAMRLGTDLSRVIVRTFGGDLQYDRHTEGGRFVIHLRVDWE